MSNNNDNCGCGKKHVDKCDCKKEKQFHDHEFEGSTRLAELDSDDAHNHRFAGISSPAIPVQGGHVHKVKSRTDFFDHFHEFEAISGLQIPVGEGKHVHFVEARTNVVDDHFHELIFATLIEAPIFEEEA